MIQKKCAASVLVLGTCLLLFNADLLAADSNKPAPDLTGTWSGTFISKSNLPAFTMTIVINRDAQGRLSATASLASECFHDSNLQVDVNGSSVVLAGSDPEGNSLTLRGTLDKTETLLRLNYVVNGSAGGHCESDRGTGDLGKR